MTNIKNPNTKQQKEKPILSGMTYVPRDALINYYGRGFVSILEDKENGQNSYHDLRNLLLDLIEFVTNEPINEGCLDFGVADGEQITFIAKNKFGKKAVFRIAEEGDGRRFKFDHRPKLIRTRKVYKYGGGAPVIEYY